MRKLKRMIRKWLGIKTTWEVVTEQYMNQFREFDG